MFHWLRRGLLLVLIGMQQATEPREHFAVGALLLSLFVVQAAGRCIMLLRRSYASVHAPKQGVFIDGKAPEARVGDVAEKHKQLRGCTCRCKEL